MKMQISFFENQIPEAIGSGVYQISVLRHDGRKAVLYIGESYSMLNRCAAHLYAFRAHPEYFGFTPKAAERKDLTLMIEILKSEPNKAKCQQLELDYIKKRSPLTQSGIKDRMKPVPQKLAAVEHFLNS